MSAFLVTMFFFYIDEGYYDFRWMKSAGNWIFTRVGKNFANE
jgi:hypothetical protein